MQRAFPEPRTGPSRGRCDRRSPRLAIFSPKPYFDGCHLDTGQIDAKACLYGDINGTRTVVLFGREPRSPVVADLEHLALQQGWRFFSFTKSACTPADVVQWYGTLKRVYTECVAWREQILSRIAALRPDLVIVSGVYPSPLVRPDGDLYTYRQGETIYRAGLSRTLARLSRSDGHTVMLGDTPTSVYDVPVCLSAHRNSILACSTRLSDAYNPALHKATEDAAASAGATYIDPTFWVCTSAPCPPVIGDFLVYRDTGHLTPPFAEALAGFLAKDLPGFPQRSGASRTP